MLLYLHISTLKRPAASDFIRLPSRNKILVSLARHLRLWPGARCRMGSRFQPNVAQYNSTKPLPESHHVDPALVAHKNDRLVSESPALAGTKIGSTEVEGDSFNQVPWSGSQGLDRCSTFEASIRLSLNIERHRIRAPADEPLDVGHLESVSE